MAFLNSVNYYLRISKVISDSYVSIGIPAFIKTCSKTQKTPILLIRVTNSSKIRALAFSQTLTETLNKYLNFYAVKYSDTSGQPLKHAVFQNNISTTDFTGVPLVLALIYLY